MAPRPHFVRWNRSVAVVARHYDPRPRKLELRQYQPLLPAFPPKYPETFLRFIYTLASRGFRKSENVSIRARWTQRQRAYPPWWQRFGQQLGLALSTGWMGLIRRVDLVRPRHGWPSTSRSWPATPHRMTFPASTRGRRLLVTRRPRDVVVRRVWMDPIAIRR